MILILLFVLTCWSGYSQTHLGTIAKQEDVDFSKMNENEIVEYIINLPNLCGSKIGIDISSIVAETIDGAIFNSSETKRVVFYNFWFSTCAPCVEEIPMLNKLYDKHKNDVDFIAITFMPESDIRTFLEENPFKFEQVRMNRVDLEQHEIIKGCGYPTTIITVDNQIIYHDSGGITTNSKYFEKVMDGLFNKMDAILRDVLKN